MGLGQKVEKIGIVKKFTQPHILNTEYDLENQTKTISYLYTKHRYKDDKFVDTITSTQQFKTHIQKNELSNLKYEDLINKINEDTSKINLNKIKSKDDILKLVDLEDTSNTEKKRRAIAICNRLLKEKNVRYSIKTCDFI